MGGTTHKLRPSPYLLQVTSQTLFFPVQNYSLHPFHSKRIPESHNLTPYLHCMVLDYLTIPGAYLKFCQ